MSVPQKITRRRLSHSEYFKAAQCAETHKEHLNGKSFEFTASFLSERLGLEVTDVHLRRMAKELGYEWMGERPAVQYTVEDCQKEIAMLASIVDKLIFVFQTEITEQFLNDELSSSELDFMKKYSQEGR